MAMSSSRDWISSLPDEVLGKILSLLPTKVAASTSVLSKRWRNLLGLVDTLCFDESMVVYSNEEEATSGSHRFLDFVDNTFALLRDSPILKKFSLNRVHSYSCCDGEYSFARVSLRVNRWILIALESGLLELHLYATPWWSGSFLETNLLTSKTLVKLTLSGDYCFEVERFYFPALKSLSLLSAYRLDHDNYSRLIDGCPVLEELFIRDADHVYPPCCGEFVKSASIKRLVVFLNLPDDKEFHQDTYFEAPSLLYLDYSSYVFGNYEVVDLDSLVEARLSLRLWESTNDYDYNDDDDDDDDDGHRSDDDGYSYSVDVERETIFGDVTKLVAGISNITTLHLSPDTLEAFHFCCESMPMFNNLFNLSIESNKEKGWQVMPLLLKSCPNLQNLVMKGLVHKVTYSCGDACACTPEKPNRKKKRKILKEEEKVCCLWTCQVKVLEISEYGGSFQELNQMRHFLGKLECLETVKVGLRVDHNHVFLRAKLLTLPRVSSKCNLQFI